jgi:hypothetical protein
MEGHNLLKVKMNGVHIERGRPEDAGDLAQKKQMDEEEKAEAKRIAEIILKCPNPCPHWRAERKATQDELVAGTATNGDSVSNERRMKSASPARKRRATRK